MRKIFSNERVLSLLVPICAALLGLLVGGIIMIIGGYNPIVGFQALVHGIIGNPRIFGETIRTMSPLLLAGLSVAFANKTGLFNIGVEGQLLVGWISSVAVGILLDLPPVLHVIVAVLASALAGGIWGFVPGLLKAKFKVNEVIVTIMLNYTALWITSALVRSPWLFDRDQRTLAIHPNASLSSEFLSSITGNSRLHWGIVIAIIMAIIMYAILERTTFGYELKATRYNQDAAQYAGMHMTRNVVLSMTIAGALGGLAGAMEGLGTFGLMTALSTFTGVGFDGIAVALLGANNPFGIIFSSFLFGGLKNAAPTMQFQANVPAELVNVINASIIFFVAAAYLIRLGLTRLGRQKEGK